jgi:hypothetical protein
MNSARDWKQEHAGFHFPTFYNFIVDFFEDTDDENSKNVANELLIWWNRYVLCFSTLNDDILMGTFDSDPSQIFPPSARQTGGSGSRNVLRSSHRRLRESCARERLQSRA